MRCRIIRTYALANLEDVPAASPAPVEVKNKKYKAGDTESEGDNSMEAPPSSLSPPKRKPGLPPGKGKVTASKGGPAISSTTGTQGPKPVVVRGKVLPPRAPQPSRPNRNERPGLIVKPKPKKTSAEVAAVAERKAALQKQADDLERKRIETLAEMELQEELEEEAEEDAVVRKVADASSLDDAVDVEMRSEAGDDAYTPVSEDSEEASSSEDNETATGSQVAPKRKQVCCVLH
jgi:hypothetical protein